MKECSKKIVSLVLAISMLTVMMVGCGKKADTNEAGAKTEDTATEATESQTAADGKAAISVSGGGEDSMKLDPGVASTLEGLSACRHLYEGLFKIGQSGQVEKGQAADYTMSEDGLTYTFTLRDDITWSDGQPVKAADFVYAWQRLISGGEDYCYLLDMIKGAEDIRLNGADVSTLGATAVDDKTIQVTLAYPCSFFVSVLAFPSTYPVRQDIAEANVGTYGTDVGTAVYNGAYELTDWTHQEKVVMTARPDYYDYANINVGELTWVLLTEESTMLASFESGDIIYSNSFPSEEAERLKDNGLQFAPGYNTAFTMLNVGEKGPEVLKDPNVRKALELAIDRQRIVELSNLDDEVANTYTPKGITDASGKDFYDGITPWFSNDDYNANCEEAKQLLADAGYANGEGFPALEYMVNNDGNQAVAEQVINDWKEVLGIDSITITLNSDSFWDTRENGDYDICYFRWYMDYVDVSNMLGTIITGASDSDYTSADFDAAYNAALSATDTATQWQNYYKCEDILSKDIPVIPLYYGQNTYLFDSAKYDGLVYYCGNFYFGYVKQK